MSVAQKRWKPAELKTMHRLIQAGRPYAEIATELERSVASLKHRLQWECRSSESRDQRNARLKEYRRQRDLSVRAGEPNTQGLNLELGCGPKPGADLLRARDQKASIPPRDLTAAFFGDPLPGYSALERRA